MTESSWILRGMPFAVMEWGTRTGRPIVLLHGYLDSAVAWSDVVSRLAGWRLALDHRGHGRSAHTAPGHGHFFPEYLADLDALLAQLPGPVDLVGHSMGGTIATMYASVRPEAVRRVVSVDGLGLRDGLDETRGRLLAFLDGQRSPPDHRAFASVDEVAERLRRRTPALSESLAMRMALHTTRATPEGVEWRFDPRHRLRGALPYRQDQHLMLLRELRCPVLSVRPEHSPFADEDVRRLEAAIPDLRVVQVPGAGHMVHLEQGALVGDVIAAFLDASPP